MKIAVLITGKLDYFKETYNNINDISKKYTIISLKNNNTFGLDNINSKYYKKSCPFHQKKSFFETD